MNTYHTIHASTMTAPALLPRIALIFSRRRQRIRALQYFDLDDGQRADVQIDVECESRAAREIAEQLRAILEVEHVWVEAMNTGLTVERRLAVA